MAIFQLIVDWSEVWILFVPLLALMLSGKQPEFMKPISIYLWVVLALNLWIDIISEFHRVFPDLPQSNTYLYNIHSIIRFICFSYFFILLRYSYSTIAAKIISAFYLLFLLINFGLFENFLNPNHVSGNLLTAESYLLLIYCMLYYLSQLIGEAEDLKNAKTFWIITGLSMYVVINFFVFLFYVPMITENLALATRMWNVHNVAYIVLAIFIAKAYHVPVRPNY